MKNEPNMKMSLEVRDLSVQLGGQTILNNVTMDVERGTLHAVLGPNGAGKTTFIRCLTGSLPHKGLIRFNFCSNGRIGYVPQFLEFDHSLPLTVTDFLLLMMQDIPIIFRRTTAMRDNVLACLEKTDCAHLAERLVGGLSGGEMRRVLLAQALTPVPEILLLDEPASNIDEVGARSFEQVLLNLRDEHGIAVIMVSHDLSTVLRIADKVTGINGTVTWSGLSSNLKDPKILEAVFGVQAFSAQSREGRGA
nr:metal ABC transporter ATP-binding protein [Desulfobulbaceae bacterium]